MLDVVAIVPSAPVLVPELAGAAAEEIADLRSAVFRAVGALPGRWVAIGVGPTDTVIDPRRAGTFAGYGADLEVALSPVVDGGPGRLEDHEPDGLPLCALIAGWVRGQVRPQACVETRVYAGDHEPDAALAIGRGLREDIAAAGDAVGVLVVADGAATLTPSAPGGHDPDSVPLQRALDDALATGNSLALARLPGGIVGRVAYQVLAGITEPMPRSAEEFYRGAPYGVGYFAGVWRP